jgi:hypothetical protein
MVGDKSGSDILKEGLTTLRSLCLRSFPEFLADIKLAALPTAVGKGGSVNVNVDVSTKVLDFTVEVRLGLISFVESEVDTNESITSDREVYLKDPGSRRRGVRCAVSTRRRELEDG